MAKLWFEKHAQPKLAPDDNCQGLRQGCLNEPAL